MKKLTYKKMDSVHNLCCSIIWDLRSPGTQSTAEYKELNKSINKLRKKLNWFDINLYDTKGKAFLRRARRILDTAETFLGVWNKCTDSIDSTLDIMSDTLAEDGGEFNQ